MLRLPLVALALTAAAATADAAIYRYDVTMELTELSGYLGAFGAGSADDVLPGMTCDEYEYDGLLEHSCSGYADLRGKYDQISYVNAYVPEIKGVLILDTMFNPYATQNGHGPICVGSYILCRYAEIGGASNYGGFLADDRGFEIFDGDGISFQNIIWETGMEYMDDGGFDFYLGETYYYSSGNGITARYTTTSLSVDETAPVPLPAGFLLLPSALFLLRRRRKQL